MPEETMLPKEEQQEVIPLSLTEKRLIGWSLGVGIVLLIILIFASGAFK